MKLNEEQLKAVTTEPGPVLVAAGPGSGKTTVLLHRIIHLIEDRAVSPDDISTVTFTQQAAREMQNRLKHHLDRNDISRIFCGTIHKLAVTWLSRIGFLQNREWLSPRKENKFLRDCLLELGQPYNREKLRNLKTEISCSRNLMIPPEDYEPVNFSSDTFKNIARKFIEWKQENNWLDYDDLLVRTYLFIKNKNIDFPSPRKHVLVDEFQDTSPLQFEILRGRRDKSSSIFAVGDVDQSLYSWRGAEPTIMLEEFEQAFPDRLTLTLETNYRSRENLVKRAANLIEHNEHRIEKTMQPTRDCGPEPELLFPADDQDEARQVLNWIESIDDSDDAAVLYRTNLQGLVFLREAHRRGMSYDIAGALLNPFDHWIGQDILAYLELARENLQKELLKRIIYRPNRFIPQKSVDEIPNNKTLKDGLLASFQQISSLNGSQLDNIEQLSANLTTLSEIKNTKSAIDFISTSINYKKYLQNQSNKKNQIDSLHKGILALLKMIGKESKDPEEFLRLGRHLQDAGRDWWKHLLESRPPESQNPVSRDLFLSTFHSAKGIEFDTVAVAGLVQNQIPNQEAAIEEERRLVYVAITRAENYLVLSSPGELLGSSGIPSRFLYEFMPDHPEVCPPPSPKTFKKRQTKAPRSFELDPEMKVHHTSFGPGRVVSVDGDRSVIAFENHGEKELLLEHCISKELLKPAES